MELIQIEDCNVLVNCSSYEAMQIKKEMELESEWLVGLLSRLKKQGYSYKVINSMGKEVYSYGID